MMESRVLIILCALTFWTGCNGSRTPQIARAPARADMRTSIVQILTQVAGESRVCSGFVARFKDPEGENSGVHATFIVTTRRCVEGDGVIVRTWSGSNLIEKIYPYVEVIATDPVNDMAALLVKYIPDDALDPLDVLATPTVCPGDPTVGLTRIEEVDGGYSTGGSHQWIPARTTCQLEPGSCAPDAGLRLPDPLQWQVDGAVMVAPETIRAFSAMCEVGSLVDDAIVGSVVFNGSRVAGMVLSRDALPGTDGGSGTGGGPSRLWMVPAEKIHRLLRQADDTLHAAQHEFVLANNTRAQLLDGGTSNARQGDREDHARHATATLRAISAALCALRDPTQHPLSRVLDRQDAQILRQWATTCAGGPRCFWWQFLATANTEADFGEVLGASVRREAEASSFCQSRQGVVGTDCHERYDHAIAQGLLRVALHVGVVGGGDPDAATCADGDASVNAGVLVDPASVPGEETHVDRVHFGIGQSFPVYSRTTYGDTRLQLFDTRQTVGPAVDVTGEWHSSANDCHIGQVFRPESRNGGVLEPLSRTCELQARIGPLQSDGQTRAMLLTVSFSDQPSIVLECQVDRNVRGQMSRDPWQCSRPAREGSSEPMALAASWAEDRDTLRMLMLWAGPLGTRAGYAFMAGKLTGRLPPRRQ